MSESILDTAKGKCYLCNRICNTEEHHIFNAYNRKKSEKYGLKVYLCHNCHNEPPFGVHHNHEVNERLKRIGQLAAMKHYGWSIEQFREIFGKNYL